MSIKELYLGEVLDFFNGKAPVPSEGGKYRIYGSNGPIGMSKEYNHNEAIILGRVGAYCGSVEICQDRFWASDNTIVAKPKKGYDIRYVYYRLLATPLRSYAGGAAQPLLTHSILRRVKIRVYTQSHQQKRIADILSAYDDLIENNRRRIVLLERAARLLYKEWFVHLRFPGHEHVKIIDGVPEGWEKKRVEELLKKHIGGGWGQDEPLGNEINPAYVIRGADIPSVISGEFDAVKLRYHKESALKSRLLEEGDIIFEVSGGSATQPVGRALRISKKILEQFKGALICASFCKRLKPKTGLLSAYLYYHIKHIRGNGEMQVFQKQSASALQNFNFEAFLEHHCVLVPSSSLLEQFSEQVALFDEQAATLALQISSLRRARDLLLPRLMNGEIAV